MGEHWESKIQALSQEKQNKIKEIQEFEGRDISLQDNLESWLCDKQDLPEEVDAAAEKVKAILAEP